MAWSKILHNLASIYIIYVVVVFLGLILKRSQIDTWVMIEDGAGVDVLDFGGTFENGGRGMGLYEGSPLEF